MLGCININAASGCNYLELSHYAEYQHALATSPCYLAMYLKWFLLQESPHTRLVHEHKNCTDVYL